eukprot:Skav233058  [mRNA]  locus=scaffold3637:21910:22850:+ [translate_table: standard]
MAEVVESWEDLCPKKKTKKPKKNDREKAPVIHQASAVRIRKKKSPEVAPVEAPPVPEAPLPDPVVEVPLPAPQVRLPEPQHPQPMWQPWQPEMCPPYYGSYGAYGSYDVFSYQAPYAQYQTAYPYYQTTYAPPWTPPPEAVPEPVVQQVEVAPVKPPKSPKSPKGGAGDIEDWEELYDESEPGSTEASLAAPSGSPSPQGPSPQEPPKACVAPPWLLSHGSRRLAKQKQT